MPYRKRVQTGTRFCFPSPWILASANPPCASGDSGITFAQCLRLESPGGCPVAPVLFHITPCGQEG